MGGLSMKIFKSKKKGDQKRFLHQISKEFVCISITRISAPPGPYSRLSKLKTYDIPI